MLGSRTLLIITVIGIALLLSVHGHFGREYVGETVILVLPKSPQAILDTDRIIADAEGIPRALAFYDMLLLENPDMEDRFAELSGAKRKAAWNEHLSVERRGQSSMLVIQAIHAEEGQARLISERAAQDIITVMGRYYAVPTDLDIHVMDGTTVMPAGPLFGFDMVTVTGSVLVLLSIVTLMLSSSPSRPRSSAAASISSWAFEKKKSEPRAAVVATEEEIRKRLSELLGGKVEG